MIQVYAFIGTAVLTFGLGSWAMMERSGRQAEKLQRVEADRVSAANVLAVDTMRVEHARAVAALEQSAADSAQRAERSANIRGQIHAAASTGDCATSPAMRALLDGLRADQNGVAR